MVIILFEIMIYASWAYVFFSRSKKEGGFASEQLHVLLFALPTTILMEVRAEYLRSGAGTFYPFSLFYFPDFKFPVAIILAGSLYAWTLYVLSHAISKHMINGNEIAFNLVHLVFFLLFLWSSRIIEFLAVGIDYWQWHKIPPARAMWVGSYLYYFRFAFPAFLVAKFFSWHENRKLRG